MDHEKEMSIKMSWIRIKQVAYTHIVTFVVVMFLNQLLLFNLCSELYCLVAALPHVSIITFLIGTWIINRSKKSGEGKGGGTITTVNSGRMNAQINRSMQPLKNHTNSNDNIEKLVSLKGSSF